MSVNMALAKLCACACGGAIVGGGAMHVAEQPRAAHVKKVHKARKMVRVAKVYRKPAGRMVKRMRRVVTTAAVAAPFPSSSAGARAALAVVSLRAASSAAARVGAAASS